MKGWRKWSEKTRGWVAIYEFQAGLGAPCGVYGLRIKLVKDSTRRNLQDPKNPIRNTSGGAASEL